MTQFYDILKYVSVLRFRKEDGWEETCQFMLRLLEREASHLQDVTLLFRKNE